MRIICWLVVITQIRVFHFKYVLGYLVQTGFVLSIMIFDQSNSTSPNFKIGLLNCQFMRYDIFFLKIRKNAKISYSIKNMTHIKIAHKFKVYKLRKKN